MQAIKINCPICNVGSQFEVASDLFSNISSGILKIQVSNNLECGHSFLIHLDRNYKVRGYSTYDFILDAKDVNISHYKGLPVIKESEVQITKKWTPKLHVPEEKLDVYFEQVLEEGAHILERSLLKTIFQMGQATLNQLFEKLTPIGEALSIKLSNNYIQQVCQKYEKRNLISLVTTKL